MYQSYSLSVCLHLFSLFYWHYSICELSVYLLAICIICILYGCASVFSLCLYVIMYLFFYSLHILYPVVTFLSFSTYFGRLVHLFAILVFCLSHSFNGCLSIFKSVCLFLFVYFSACLMFCLSVISDTGKYYIFSMKSHWFGQKYGESCLL